MKACIPTEGEAGLNDVVHDHFGSAPYFTLYDTETGEVTVVKNRNRHHSHGTCHPMTELAGYNIDCVVCSGLGWRAIGQLKKEGVKVYQASGEKVGDVVERLKSKGLPGIDPAKVCHGRGGGGGSMHGIRRGAGRGSKASDTFGQGEQGRQGGRGNNQELS